MAKPGNTRGWLAEGGAERSEAPRLPIRQKKLLLLWIMLRRARWQAAN
jgi:hypothetical protein